MKQLLSLLGLLGLSVLITLPPNQGQAAEIWRERSTDMGCTLMLQGVIEAGDADRLSSVLNEGPDPEQPYWSERLCLNSPGGSLAEAIRIVDAMYDIGTAVRSDQQCLSACAIIFMGGSRYIEGGIGPTPDRHLHAGGTLGFHAPSLIVSDGNYTQEAVQKAYTIAVGGIGDLIRRSDRLVMTPWNFSQMLDTPPSGMLMIDTPGRAAQWNLRVHGIQEPATFTKMHLANACATFNGGFDYQVNSTATLETTTNRVEGQVIMGFDDAGGMFCDISYRPGHDRFDLVDYDQFGDAALYPALFYPANVPLKQLLSSAPGVNVAIPPLVTQGNATCHVYSNDRLTDKEPCLFTQRIKINADLRREIEITYDWPSGARTVVTANPDFVAPRCCGEAYHLNGQPAENLYDYKPNAEYSVCYRSSVTGNVFCPEDE